MTNENMRIDGESKGNMTKVKKHSEKTTSLVDNNKNSKVLIKYDLTVVNYHCAKTTVLVVKNNTPKGSFTIKLLNKLMFIMIVNPINSFKVQYIIHDILTSQLTQADKLLRYNVGTHNLVRAK